MPKRRRYLQGVGLTATTLLPGCSGGDEGTSTANATGTPSGPGGSATSGLGDQVAKLAADDGAGDDNFGFSVGLSDDGSTAVLGALSDRHADGEPTGSAYVFTDGADGWTQVAKLAAPDLPAGANFGRSVGIDGDGTTALVGAPGDTDAGGDVTGAVYLFERAGGAWDRQPRLRAGGGDAYGSFGIAVGIDRDGTTAVIGAPGDDQNGDRAGAAFVFGTDRDGWGQRGTLTAGNGDDGDNFGAAVALSRDGKRAAVGAPLDEDPNGSTSGSAYVYGTDGTDWRQRARLAAGDGDSGDSFGRAVALDATGLSALVGANRDEDPNGRGGGAAYVFEDSGSSWEQTQKLTDSDGTQGDGFGFSVTLDDGGTVALVGAIGARPDSGDRTGAVSVFTTDDSDWRRVSVLSAEDGDSEDYFGSAVALDREATTALVGAFNDEDPNGSGDSLEPGAGSAYVFE